jgi:hypothetical protein
LQGQKGGKAPVLLDDILELLDRRIYFGGGHGGDASCSGII